MSPSNLSRVIVGICNRPRGKNMLWIKCQWLSNKSLSQGSDHPSKAASLTTDQHRKKKAAGTTAEIPISMAGKGRGRKGSLSFNSNNKHFWVCFLLSLHEHLRPKPWWASGGISQIQTSQSWYSFREKYFGVAVDCAAIGLLPQCWRQWCVSLMCLWCHTNHSEDTCKKPWICCRWEEDHISSFQATEHQGKHSHEVFDRRNKPELHFHSALRL